MLWKESIPNIELSDEAGNRSQIELIAGKWNDQTAVAPPPNSWANDPKNEVMVVNIKMQPNALLKLPAATKGINRTLYFYEGTKLTIAGKEIPNYSGVELLPEYEVELQAHETEVSIFILQGKPIGEQVMQYGPFVMNTKEEINQAFEDYHRTQFGGWPWPRYDQVHERSRSRFAHHADGTLENKEG
jgi:redox-sensitive bicupin YhaK (pirin superfamily)